MKPLKYTVAALALIAAASFTQSAKAQNLANGDVMLGVYDTTQSVSSSYELNLGAYNLLTNGETFDLGSSINTLLSGGQNNEFSLSVTGGTGAQGGLAASEIGLSNLIPEINNSTISGLPATNATENTDIGSMNSPFNAAIFTHTLTTGTSSTGTSFIAVSVSDSTNGSYAKEVNANGGSFGLGGGTPGAILVPYSNTASAEFDVFTQGASAPTEIGTFTFGGTAGDTTLTFNALSTPEPSAYALGLCAIALFFVLKRRSSVA